MVVTGASSGLGRAAAVEFARRGWRVALAARRGPALKRSQSLCEQAGGQACSVVTDVTSERDVARLVETVTERWGRIDAWVSNAGVTLFAPLAEAPFDEHRRVIETNLFGAMHCARAILPAFRRQGHGVLIHVGSIVSRIGQPYVPSYTVSKFALRGLSEALRIELADEPDIHVCTLLPYTIDTPHFESGANRTGREAHAMPPVQSPEVVARALVDLAERPRRERAVPRYIAAGLALHALLPAPVERVVLHALREWHFAPRPQEPTRGNLFEPGEDEGAVRGTRAPRIRTLPLLAWLAAHFAAQGARALVPRARSRAG